MIGRTRFVCNEADRVVSNGDIERQPGRLARSQYPGRGVDIDIADLDAGELDHRASLDGGGVEDVVDDREQRLG